MEAKKARRVAAKHRKAVAAVTELAELLPHIPTADSDASNMQRIFKIIREVRILDRPGCHG